LEPIATQVAPCQATASGYKRTTENRNDPAGIRNVKQTELFDIRGHVAFVTGAASGLGLAYAEVMAENGAKVVLVDVDSAGVQKEAARLRSLGCNVETAVLDVADGTALQAAIDRTAEGHGRLDAVFANVGISSGPGFAVAESGQLERIDPKLFQRVLDINLTATMQTMKFAAPHMKRRRSGSIVATTSIAGLKSEPLVGYAYTATKAAVGNLVRHAAVELAPHNVRVNAIAPGPFITNIRDGVMHRDPKVVEQFAAMVPLGRVAKTDEIKGLALLLASPAGSFITGAVIPIDGGATAK
jgi:NAD(P)-dependent dehydrogenase (short-subunit alcohol dehydrogenase family)